ncbi:tetratricopeptide repeat protein [candidate division KSB1 bacterium]|nr:tetratricopeptide repeat protein [candidate division KSB1 bacterium]
MSVISDNNGNPKISEMTFEKKRFFAQEEYAESIFLTSCGEIEASIQSLENALEIDPGYAPAIMSLGSVEYQRNKPDHGRELFHSLLSLPPSAADGGESDLGDIIEEAGDFLIQSGHYADGLELFRAALNRFPKRDSFFRGVSCCASHENLLEEALRAAEKAYELDPENQECVNDLGWSLFEVGRLDEALQYLSRAVEMDPGDDLARENLRICKEEIKKRDF